MAQNEKVFFLVWSVLLVARLRMQMKIGLLNLHPMSLHQITMHTPQKVFQIHTLLIMLLMWVCNIMLDEETEGFLDSFLSGSRNSNATHGCGVLGPSTSEGPSNNFITEAGPSIAPIPSAFVDQGNFENDDLLCSRRLRDKCR